MKLPFQIDLTGKVVVVTGAGGVICSVLAEAMAMTGAKVALLDLNEDAAKKHADDITAKGYIAKDTSATCLRKRAYRRRETRSRGLRNLRYLNQRCPRQQPESDDRRRVFCAGGSRTDEDIL